MKRDKQENFRAVKQAEPVAWMLTEIGPLGKGAKVARTSKPIAWDKTQWKLEPLYAAPQPAAAPQSPGREG